MGGCLKKINPVDYLRPVVRCNRCNKYNASIIPDHAELVTAIAQEGVESFLESNFDLDDMAIHYYKKTWRRCKKLHKGIFVSAHYLNLSISGNYK